MLISALVFLFFPVASCQQGIENELPDSAVSDLRRLIGFIVRQTFHKKPPRDGVKLGVFTTSVKLAA